MTNKWSVFMTLDGRISMAGLSGGRRLAFRGGLDATAGSQRPGA